MTTMNRLFLSFLLAFGVLMASGQPLNRYDYYFGDSTNTLNTICNAILVDSTYFLAVGMVNNLGDVKIGLVKTDFWGNKMQEKLIGDTGYMLGLNYGYGESMIMDRDSFFIVCSYRISAVGWDGFIVKFDRNLDTLWARVYDMPPVLAGCSANSNPFNYFSVIRQCPDGNYILGCNYHKECVNGQYRSALCKIDTAGNVLWWKVYPDYNEIFDIELASDSGFYIPENFSNQLHVVKTDSLGDVQWSVQVNHQNLPCLIPRVAIYDTFVYAASLHWRDNTLKSTSLVLAKVNVITQQLEWEKVFIIHDAILPSEVYVHILMELDSESNIVIAGTARNDALDSWFGILLKLNSQGDSLWSRYYYIPGHIDVYKFNDLILMPDGGYAMFGSRFPYNGSYQWSAWMVRTDSMGWAPGSQSVGVEEINIGPPLSSFYLFPNPADDYVDVRFKQPSTGKLYIADMLGREVYSTLVVQQEQIRVPTTGLPAGNYIVKFRGEDGVNSQGKVLVVGGR